MVTVSETVIRFMSIGADKIVRDEDRVDKAISKTASCQASEISVRPPDEAVL